MILENLKNSLNNVQDNPTLFFNFLIGSSSKVEASLERLENYIDNKLFLVIVFKIKQDKLETKLVNKSMRIYFNFIYDKALYTYNKMN